MSGILTTREVIAIITSCKKNSVKNITYGNLTVEFDYSKPPYQSKNASSKDAASVDRSGDQQQDIRSDSSLDSFEDLPFVDYTDAEMDKNDELEYLSIEDPAMFEELTLRALVEDQG